MVVSEKTIKARELFSRRLRELLDNARISKKIIQLIIGHAGRDIDERVYTHKTTQQLIDAINAI